MAYYVIYLYTDCENHHPYEYNGNAIMNEINSWYVCYEFKSDCCLFVHRYTQLT